jgi:hypothetical protein
LKKSFALLFILILPSVLAIHGDVTGDNQVNLDDLLHMLRYLQSGTPYDSSVDINNDTTINVFDLVAIGQNWGANETNTTPPMLNNTTPGMLFFVGDAETGDASQWCVVHSAVALPPPVSSPVRDGVYSFKSEVQDGALIYDTERSEYANGPTLCGKYTYTEGSETFTAVSIYPESNFPRYSHWSLVTQFKGPHTGTPPMQISLQNDKWEIVGSGRVSPRPRWFIANISRGTWNDFILHAYWSPNATVGWFEVYYQGALVIPKTYTSTMYIDSGVATPLFLSVGQYRDTSPTSGTGVLYVDAVKVGTTLQSVMPPPINSTG